MISDNKSIDWPETVPAQLAQGRVLTDDVKSGRQLPPSDNSAMDGYAVRVADLAHASRERAVNLTVAFEVPAGAVPDRSIASGQAARIFTGAAIPAGADAVVRQEDTERNDDRVSILVSPSARE